MTIKKTYPTKRVEISKIHVENPSSIMEVPPNEEELEKILEELENKDGKISKDEKGKESEADDDREDVDYSSMKVTEIKEILKKKELPVSGTKAELIKRLQTWRRRFGSFYHSGSQNHKITKFGQLYLFH